MQRLINKRNPKPPLRTSPLPLNTTTKAPKQINKQEKSWPTEILFMLTRELTDFQDILALSATCRVYHARRVALLEAFVKQHYPNSNFLNAFEEAEKEKTILEKLRRLYTWHKIKEAKLEVKAINSIAEALCLMQGLGENSPLKENWRTLFTAAAIGDLETCKSLLTNNLDPKLGCVAIMRVMHTEFMANQVTRANYSLNPIKNENFVYNLLFDCKQGQDILEIATKESFHNKVFATGTISKESFYFNFLDACPKLGETEKLTAQQEFLIGAISAGYFKVTRKLIEIWKVKPKIPIMARLFMQVTRHSPKSPWYELFVSLSQEFSEKKRKELADHFWKLKSTYRSNQYIQEQGHVALIPELTDLLKLPPYPPTVIGNTPTTQQHLLATNIEMGRLKRVKYLLEERHLPFDWSQQKGAWISLHLKNSEKADKMLADLLNSKSLDNDRKKAIIETLLEDEYLKSIINAYQINQLSSIPKNSEHTPNKEEKIGNFLQSFSPEAIKTVLAQAIQQGYLSLLKHLLQTKLKIFKQELTWFEQETIKADRLGVMQWLLQENLLTKDWIAIRNKAIQYNSPNIFAAAMDQLGFQREEFKRMVGHAIQNNSTKIIANLIEMNGSDNYQTLLDNLLDHLVEKPDCLQDRDNLLTQWLLTFKTLFEKHRGYLDLNQLNKLYQYIKENNFQSDYYEKWLRLLLTLANQISNSQQNVEQDSQSHEYLDKKTRFQEKILGLLERDTTNIIQVFEEREMVSLSPNTPLNLLIEWLEGDYSAFSLTEEQQKNMIPSLLQRYLVSQSEENSLLLQALIQNRHSAFLESVNKILETMMHLLLKFPMQDKNADKHMALLILACKRYDLLEVLMENKIITSETLKNYKQGISAHYQFFGKQGQKRLDSILDSTQTKKLKISIANRLIRS